MTKKQGPRPYLMLRMSPEFLDVVHDAADELGVAASEYVRDLIREDLERRGLNVPRVFHPRRRPRRRTSVADREAAAA
jgi:hypothetical protein